MAIEDLVLKFRAALDATERLPRAELAAYQGGLAAKLLAHAAAHTRAYGARLRGRRLSGACDADWLRLPLLTWADLQDAPEAVFADAVPPFCGPVETGSTSGSTAAR
ncbi:hypothetical protein GCM10008171_24480 [Methylopila jiangsuensis]|uniref:Uncharacterized protein n=1 Tax=Methylopila jiangsuensis TaxID=586230 RepID=A0A9W6JK45_9HYPH|nr:hypothetical protein [Methylopila jiangsuensis]MDR6286466.1 hypothetical protein [Methylopila jiangsuensis]GLK77194.1 hypothetical protein GCM10008171_24480 [Methylopila jiangsuensis]